ncbi:hypothetical protein EVB27_026 [Rhizobium phage RHph_TM16]|nr:hypothetical protein EVB27_026 [Rhizobium phage RHph_TM16]
MSDLLKRPGRVRVTRDIIQDSPNEVREILGQILVVDARPRFHFNDVEYMGYSDHFEEQEDDNNVPLYDINVEMDKDDNMSVEFVLATEE